MPSLSGSSISAAETLDILPLFNPIDCTSLGVIKVHLRNLQQGQVLEVLSNRFQQKEIEAWARKFNHAILGEFDESGLVRIYLERSS